MRTYPTQDKRSASWKDIGWATLAYAALTVIMTYPAALHPVTLMVTESGDPLIDLYMCREWMHSLAEGRIPVFCADIGRPFGYPFAFTPLGQYHAVLYMLLHPFCNDTLIHNIFFFSSFILAGVGAYLLAIELTGHKRASLLAGVIYAFGAPHAMQSLAHTPSMTVQWIPLFLLFWFRFIRNPNRQHLLLSVLFFALVACSDPYQSIFCIFLGGLYLFYHWWSNHTKGQYPYLLLERWLTLFCALTLLVLLPPLWHQIWMEKQGYKLSWDPASFFRSSVPLVAYFVPSKFHFLGRIFTVDYVIPGQTSAIEELCSYYGVLTIFLVILAFALGVRFPNRSYVWCSLLACVFLSWAPILHLRGYALYQYLPILGHMRSCNRWNIPGGLMLALLASAGFTAVEWHGSKFLDRRGIHSSLHKVWAWAWFLFATIFTSLDLCIAPYPVTRIPDLPPFFKNHPPPAKDECILELPVFSPGASSAGGLMTYWQSYHRWPTTGGYTAYAMPHHTLWSNSPFGTQCFMEEKPDPLRDIVAWDCRRFLDAHKVRYVILHSQEHQEISPEVYERLSTQIRAWMQASPVYQDSDTTVYDPRLIDSDRDYAIILQDGFHGKEHCGDVVFRYAGEKSRVRLFLKNESQGFVTFKANSIHQARRLRVLLDGCAIGRCEISPNKATFQTRPLRLGAGEHELLILADGSFRPPVAGFDLTGDKDTSDLSLCFYKIDWVRSDDGTCFMDGVKRLESKQGL